MTRTVCAVRNGHIKRITDQDIQSSVLEIMGTNVSTNYITCPADPQKTLGIKLPFLVMIIKNVCLRVHVGTHSLLRAGLRTAMSPTAALKLFVKGIARRRVSAQLKKYFTFEVQVLDDKNVRRRFRASNYQSTTRVPPPPPFGATADTHAHSILAHTSVVDSMSIGEHCRTDMCTRRSSTSRLTLYCCGAGEAIYMYNADALGRRLESDPVQLVRLHAARVWH